MLRSIAPIATIPPLPSQFNPQKTVSFPKSFKFRSPENPIFQTKSNLIARSIADYDSAAEPNSDWEIEIEIESDEDDDDGGSPWEGAIMYERNAGVSHLEYCTTLERLGLGKVASAVSRNRASEMGLRVAKSVKEFPDGTPVLISADVSRRKGKLRLDGIVRTVIALNCNRCGEPAAQSVYSDLSLLLCEDPIKESETINMGITLGKGKSKAFGMGETDDEDDEDALIDLDDQLYFPLEQKTIDISKNIRDLVHVEITITAICNPNCKGLCLNCGTNLNFSSCTCKKSRKVEERGPGPLGDLRKRMVSK